MPATSTGSSSCPKTTVSPSDLGFASYSDDKTIKIYDVRSNQLLQHYNAHKGPVNEISFHPTGYYMASCSTDAKVKIWDLRKGKALYSLYSHSGSVNSVDFSFAGDYFATGGDDKNLLLWKSNFFESKTREAEMIRPKVKVTADKVVKFESKVEKLAEEAPVEACSPRISREKLGDEVEELVEDCSAQGEARPEVVEVGGDEKINNNLERIMHQMDRIFVTLKDMESRVTMNEEDIMKVCNFIKNDVAKTKVHFLSSVNKADYL